MADDLAALALACMSNAGTAESLYLAGDLGLPSWLALRATSADHGDDDWQGMSADALADLGTRSRRWTAEEKAFLEDNIGSMELADIARALGRTRNAVKIRAARRDISLRQARPDAGIYNARQVAELLGLSCSKIVANLIDAGHLQAEVGGDNPLRPIYRIPRGTVADFMRHPVAGIVVKPERVRDPVFRAAWLAAGHPVYLTGGQAASQLGIATNTLAKLAMLNLVHSVRWGNYYYRRDDLPVIRRILEGRRQKNIDSRKGHPRASACSPEEEQLFLSGLALGYNSAEMNDLTGRSAGAIHRCWARFARTASKGTTAPASFLWRSRGEKSMPALLGLPTAFPNYPVAAALDSLRRGTPTAADWPHLRAWLRAWFNFWLVDSLPRGAGTGLQNDLYVTSHRLAYRIPNTTSLEDTVRRGIDLLNMVGLDPIACRWDARWEPHRLACRAIPLDALVRCPIDDAPAIVSLAALAPEPSQRSDR